MSTTRPSRLSSLAGAGSIEFTCMPSTQPWSSTRWGAAISRSAWISTRDWKNRPPRTVSGAVSVMRAAGLAACDSVVRWPKRSASASAAMTQNRAITTRRAHSPRF